jgi:hypothetical protein
MHLSAIFVFLLSLPVCAAPQVNSGTVYTPDPALVSPVQAAGQRDASQTQLQAPTRSIADSVVCAVGKWAVPVALAAPLLWGAYQVLRPANAAERATSTRRQRADRPPTRQILRTKSGSATLYALLFSLFLFLFIDFFFSNFCLQPPPPARIF